VGRTIPVVGDLLLVLIVVLIIVLILRGPKTLPEIGRMADLLAEDAPAAQKEIDR
jgi:Sec-independent protein translocase protein TatA